VLIYEGGELSLTISVRYDYANDLKFMTELMGLNRSEMLRELIDEGRKMKSIERQGKPGSWSENRGTFNI
jgi:hypothetical protein